jgi:hypothetical protein
MRHRLAYARESGPSELRGDPPTMNSHPNAMQSFIQPIDHRFMVETACECFAMSSTSLGETEFDQSLRVEQRFVKALAEHMNAVDLARYVGLQETRSRAAK